MISASFTYDGGRFSHRYGQLGSVLLAPSNAIALVEFLEVGEAKKAFRALAYFKLRSAPLFLEWAPLGILDQKGGGDGAAASAGGAEGAAAAAGATSAAADEEEGDGTACTLFVKNLNFATDGAHHHHTAAESPAASPANRHRRANHLPNIAGAKLRAAFEERKLAVRSATVVSRFNPKLGKSVRRDPYLGEVDGVISARSADDGGHFSRRSRWATALWSFAGPSTLRGLCASSEGCGWMTMCCRCDLPPHLDRISLCTPPSVSPCTPSPPAPPASPAQLKLSDRTAAAPPAKGKLSAAAAALAGRDRRPAAEGDGKGGAAAASGPAAAGGRRAETGVGKPCEKLMVRNLPFEASKQEVKELFAAFGQLKTLRLPKKFDGSHRGFAFVEFGTKGEAAKALAALQSTHLYVRRASAKFGEVGAMRRDSLRGAPSDGGHSPPDRYGRHLVLQYAEAEQSVDSMRAKLQVRISPASPPHPPRISPASPPHLPRISPASPLHLPRISPASPPHLPCISPASALYLGRAEKEGGCRRKGVSSASCDGHLPNMAGEAGGGRRRRGAEEEGEAARRGARPARWRPPLRSRPVTLL